MGAAVAAVGSVGSIVNGIESLFGGSSTSAARVSVDGMVSQVLAAPNSPASQRTIIRLRCLSGDETAVAAWNAVSGEAPVAVGGCGFGTQDGRDYARAGLARIQAAVPSLGIGGGLSPSAIAPIYNAATGKVFGFDPLVLVVLGLLGYVIIKKLG